MYAAGQVPDRTPVAASAAVGIALIAQRVELGGDDHGGGNPARPAARSGEAFGSSRSVWSA
jgi:hypothetical protein